MKLSQDPTKEQESEPKAKIGKKMRRSWFPAAVLFLCLLTLTSRAGQANTMQVRSGGVEEQQASWSNIGAVLDSIPWRNKTSTVQAGGERSEDTYFRRCDQGEQSILFRPELEQDAQDRRITGQRMGPME